MKKVVASILGLTLAVSSLFTLAGCEEHEHTGKTWGGDNTHHWYVCDVCEAAYETDEHDYEETMDGLDIVKTCKTCGYSYVAESIPEHEHTYDDTFSYNEAFHFKTCTFEGCLVQDEKAEHLFGTPEIVQETGKITKTYQCQSCDYEKVETITIDTVIKDESAWNLAFDNLELKNFQMTVSIKSVGEAGIAPNPTGTNECIITEDGCYVQYGLWETDRTIYTQKGEDGKFDLYVKDGDSQWKSLDDPEGEFHASFSREATIKINYAENFKNFTYNPETGEYTCPTNIECTAYTIEGAPYPEAMICFNNVVKVADGKISHIECDYYFEGEQDQGTQSFIYYNIGIAEFEIPEEVKNNAIPGGDLEDLY